METQETQQNNVTKVALPVLGIVVIAILGFVFLKPDTNTTAPEVQNTPAVTTQTTEPTTVTSETAYKAGTYTAVGEYTSPGGQEELGVTLTVDSTGVVTDSKLEIKATRPISKVRQEDFEANYTSEVVGKNIAELNLGKISGSSLTPKGFNDAVEKIKTDARS